MFNFRHNIWDPWLIMAQIVCVQTLYYLSLGLWLSITFFFTGGFELTLDYMLSSKGLNIQGLGWLTVFGFVLNTATSALWLLFVVGRAKLCLDFACTLHVYHLVCCICYDGWPSFSWWVLNIVTTALTTVMGEYVCMKRELREIPVLGGRRKETS
eukprot:comp10686_c0_seq1/m.5360 comp10686_c0_seq1/g.5360  ORF comp10686_c0_seq1/g.5360 comp10686_c0_seq1/m.5360 type:complete len:155 (-) comp10686_c0_seq1:119-583(-)